MKKLYFILFLLLCTNGFSQSLVDVVNLPPETFFNYGYGLVYDNGSYWISSGSQTAGDGLIKSVDANGNLLSTITINYPTMQESQGLAFDGTNFWYVERKTARCDIFKVSPSGEVLDSITSSQLFGGSWYMGGAAWDGTGLWISIYYPNTSAALYKVDVNTKTLIDTIAVNGQQPEGIAVNGDTIFYSMDDNDGDPEAVYAVDMTTGNTLFSFPVPDPNGQNPRGLAWDGTYLWLLADSVGGYNARQLFVYDLGGSGTPQISVSPTSLVFPQTTVGDTSHTTVTVSNIGTADLDITDITFNNSVFSSPAGPFPITIPPGGNQNIQVDFHPAGYQTYTGVMTIVSNDLATPTVEVDLSGQGVLNGPNIVLSATSHNFGNVWISGDGNAYWKFTISNTGDAPLEISDMHFTLPEFSFESESIPFQIAPTESKSVRVIFTPSQTVTYNDTLFIQSNDVQNPVVKISVSGNGILGNYEIGYQFWAFQVPDNPRISYQEHRVIGLKPINDINGDGISDVIVSTNNYMTMALDGAGGITTDTLWLLNTYFNNSNAGSIGMSNDYGVQDALSIVSDLNGDGKNDVVIGTGGGNEHVYALNGVNGHILWAFGNDYTYGLGDFEAVDGRRDFNGDGVPDILAIADGNNQGTGYHSAYLFNGVNGNIIWQYFYPGPVVDYAFGKTIISVNDVTGDGVPDAVIAVGNNGTTDLDVICLNGTNGQPDWIFPVSGYEPKELLELPVPGQTPDVIASQYFGKVYRIDGETGAQVWEFDYGFTGMIQIARIRDINGDNIDDILIAAFSGGAVCLSGETGQQLWSYPMAYQYGVAAVPDLNNDGVDDMLTGDQNGVFYCISGTGSPLFFSHTFPGERVYTVNALPSIDGNASYELLVGTENGKVICYSGGLNAVPVELTSFTANAEGNNVNLKWTASTQLNNKGFEIQRKYGNGDYQDVSFVKGDGTTSEEKSYSYTDKDLREGKYTYRLKQIDLDGSVNYSNSINVSIEMPTEFTLSQNYPNPFNPSTTINFSVPQKTSVKLIVYDILGKEVKTLVNGDREAGTYSVSWNGLNNNDQTVSTGIYIYRITAGDFVREKKMILMK